MFTWLQDPLCFILTKYLNTVKCQFFSRKNVDCEMLIVTNLNDNICWHCWWSTFFMVGLLLIYGMRKVPGCSFIQKTLTKMLFKWICKQFWMISKPTNHIHRPNQSLTPHERRNVKVSILYINHQTTPTLAPGAWVGKETF